MTEKTDNILLLGLPQYKELQKSVCNCNRHEYVVTGVNFNFLITARKIELDKKNEFIWSDSCKSSYPIARFPKEIISEIKISGHFTGKKVGGVEQYIPVQKIY